MPRHEAVTDYVLDAANIIGESGWWDRQVELADRAISRQKEQPLIEQAIHEAPASPEATQQRLSVTAEAMGAALLKDGVAIEELFAFLGDFAETVDSVHPDTSITQKPAVPGVASVVRHALDQREHTESLLRKVIPTETQTEPEPSAPLQPPAPPVPDRPPLKEKTFWTAHSGVLDLSRVAISAAPDPVVIKVEPDRPLPQQSLLDPEDTAYILIDNGAFHAGRPGERQGERLQNAFDPEATVVMRPLAHYADPETIILPVPKPWEVPEPFSAWPQ